MRARVMIGAVVFAVAVASGIPVPVPASAVGTPAPAATTGPQLVQSTGATETTAAKSLTATFPAATTIGDLLVLSASVYTGTTGRITSVTDSAGRSWTRIGTCADFRSQFRRRDLVFGQCRIGDRG